jgi:hypothetical protein
MREINSLTSRSVSRSAAKIGDHAIAIHTIMNNARFIVLSMELLFLT